LQTPSAVKRLIWPLLRCIAASKLKQKLSLRLPPPRADDYLSERGNWPSFQA
jgi:hypothetical protein